MEPRPETPAATLPDWLAGLAAELGYERPRPRVSEHPRAYITEVSVPSSGDNGVQRLFRPMREPEPLPEREPEAEAGR
jgi:hypothetical protein